MLACAFHELQLDRTTGVAYETSVSRLHLEKKNRKYRGWFVGAFMTGQTFALFSRAAVHE